MIRYKDMAAAIQSVLEPKMADSLTIAGYKTDRRWC